ncbi:NusG domain II-containing protein [Eubacteriales bacterium OttesenSCG-928-A19]|nr:NusG domain II-containing protein [Eubacteriales bacterium OttesenSCG-928-A19]
MLRRKDWIIIGVVLLVAAAVYGGMLLLRSGQSLSGAVDIYVDGVLYATAPLDTAGEILVEQPGGEVNVVAISSDGSVRMAHSSCKNQLCVQQGQVTADNWTRRALGHTIVCLPNRVLVELALKEDHPSLSQDDLPDI